MVCGVVWCHAGIGLDLNEPTAFCSGQLQDGICVYPEGPAYMVIGATSGHHSAAPLSHASSPSKSAPLHNVLPPLPYTPGGVPLSTFSLNTSAQQSWAPHLRVHNLFGHLQSQATLNALQVAINSVLLYSIARIRSRIVECGCEVCVHVLVCQSLMHGFPLEYHWSTGVRLVSLLVGWWWQLGRSLDRR